MAADKDVAVSLRQDGYAGAACLIADEDPLIVARDGDTAADFAATPDLDPVASSAHQDDTDEFTGIAYFNRVPGGLIEDRVP